MMPNSRVYGMTSHPGSKICAIIWENGSVKHFKLNSYTVLLELFAATLFYWFAHSGLSLVFAET